MAVPRRYTQEEVDSLLDNVTSATKSELQQLRNDVSVIGKSLGDLSIALTGLAGVSKGAIPELRDQIAVLQREWATYQAALPAAINAGVEAQQSKMVVIRQRAFSKWWQLVAANSVSGAIGGLLVFFAIHH